MKIDFTSAKIIVTGGAGFVGSALVKGLIDLAVFALIILTTFPTLILGGIDIKM